MVLNNKTSYYSILLLIFFINFVFKLIYISAPSLWYDEIISVKDTLLDFGHIKHEAEWDKNPPFYHYVLWVWSKLFGISELGVRSMSAFFSAMTATILYIIANKINGRVSAAFVALIFTFHPFLYYYSQEARCYSLLIFLISCNIWIIYSLRLQPNIYKAIFLGIVNFLIFYTHYIAGLILAFQFIYLAFSFKKQWLYLILIYLTPIVLVLLRFTKKQYKVIFLSSEMSKEKANVPLSNFDTFLKAIKDLYFSPLIFIIFILLLVYFWSKYLKKNKIKDILFHFKLYIIFSPIFCITLLYILGMITNVFDGRYLIFISPFIILSFSLINYSSNKLIVVSLFAIAFMFEITTIKFNQSKKMDYKFAAFLTKEIQKKEDVIILLQTHDIVGLYTYYYDKNLFKSKSVILSKSEEMKELLEPKNIYFVNNNDDLKNINFNVNKPILFFQTYQKENDNIGILNYFKNLKYFRYSSGQIEGVKFSYLKKL